MRILVLAKDPNFLLEIEKLAQVFKYDFLPLESVAIGDLEEETVLFIDEDMPTGMKILREIQDRQLPIKIIYLTSHLFDGQTLETLMIQYKVDAILSKPFIVNHLKAALRKVCEIDAPDTEGSLVTVLPQELLDRYEETKIGHLSKLIELAKSIGKTLDKKKLQEFKVIVHGIAGSAQSFGFAQVTRLCKNMEYRIDDEIGDDETRPVSETMASSLFLFIKVLILNFLHIYPDDELKKTSKEQAVEKCIEKTRTGVPAHERQATARPLIYMVCHDTTMIHLFQQLGDELRAEVMVETDPKTAEEQLKSGGFDPYCLVVEEYYPLHHFYGEDLIDVYLKTSQHPKPDVVMFLEKESISEQLKSLRQGITFFIKSPPTVEDVRRVVTFVINKVRHHHYKILILDDDEIACELAKEVLESKDYEVQSLTDETKLLDVLGDFDPHLLILDINLPKYRGWELLRLLRSNIRFLDLIILVFTGIEGVDTERKAMALGADEVITKPYEQDHFQALVRHLIKRSQTFRRIKLHDTVTGFYRPQAFQVALQELVAQNTDIERTGILLTLEMNGFRELPEYLKRAEIDEILITLANTLREFFHGYSLCGYMGQGKFSLLFEEVP